ncbi:MAG: helix-turn-helix transcriptional regulator [Firmicutes bacterium]|nr:helix-turn-helix transcriptional regulator [Bacillota bacterium]
MINKVHFGKRIARLRRGLGLSQMDLAEKLGVTPQAVSKWETGATLPDIELLLELSKLYETPINDMLEESDWIEKLATRPFKMDEVACFVEEPAYNREWIKVLLEKKADIFQDLYEESVLAGFTKIDSYVTGRGYTENDESELADLARSLGVNLELTGCLRYCYK